MEDINKKNIVYEGIAGTEWILRGHKVQVLGYWKDWGVEYIEEGCSCLMQKEAFFNEAKPVETK